MRGGLDRLKMRLVFGVDGTVKPHLQKDSYYNNHENHKKSLNSKSMCDFDTCKANCVEVNRVKQN